MDATLFLKGKDAVSGDESKISSRFHCGGEDGGSGGVAEGDWPGV
jgi:hypothetical protein